MSAVAVSILVVLAGLAAPAHANAFLGSHTHLGGGKRLVSKGAVEQAFSLELDVASGAHVRRLEEELGPLFAAMPKNAHGNLELSVTRYALHRHFAQRYGWYVVGLEPAGGSWTSSSPGSIMKDRVPAYIEELFEERLRGQGLGLHELAVFAATLLDLVRSESLHDLQTVYTYNGKSPSEPLAAIHLDRVVHDYIILHFHSFDAVANPNQTLNLRTMEAELRKEFVIWRDVNLWATDTHHAVELEQARRNSFAEAGTFDAVAEFAQELGQRFGAFQDLECKSLKNQLMEMEYRGTGRVMLSDFYSGHQDLSWTFTESVDYLRALGALDESDPSRMSVIIPNFVMSPTNCITPSSFYSVCCLNECESLMSALESAVGGPDAAPERIVEVVAALPSDTEVAPRVIPGAQFRRLEDIAARNGGSVPLHGRLFAQWMHHAYPRECPYPHLANTTSPVSPDEWIKNNKVDSTEASDGEMARHAQKKSDPEELAIAMTPEAKAEALPWIAVEELVISPEPARGRGRCGALTVVGLFALLAASALRGPELLGQRHLLEHSGKAEKHFV